MDIKHRVRSVDNWTLIGDSTDSKKTLLSVWEPVAVPHHRLWGYGPLPDNISLGKNYLNGKRVSSAAFTNTIREPVKDYTIKDEIYYFRSENGQVYRCLVSKMYANPKYTQLLGLPQLEAFIKKRRIPLVE